MFVAQHFTPRWKREWIPLATQQLRLRNLIQILAFSIENGRKKTIGSIDRDEDVNNYLMNDSYYFTLHATIMSAPFYTSEKLRSDSPKWKELHISTWGGDMCSSSEALVIRIWFSNSKESDDKVLAVWGIYLSGLIYLGPKLSADIPLKPNSVVFLMPGGYFTDPKCVESAVKIRYTSVIVNQNNVRPSYSVNSLQRLQALQQVIRKEMAEAEVLKKKISMGDFFRAENRGRTTLRKLLSKHKSKTHHSDLIKVKENIEVAKFRVDLLNEEKRIIAEKIKGLNKQIEALSDSNQLLESKIMENYRVLRREVHNHREWKRSYIDRREKYLHSKAMLNFRTKQLISELNLIYPIQEISSDKYTICGVHLPNSEDFAGHDDLQISIALGFVTHVIQMISVFLQIPLRYPVIHFGSKSRIIDQITDKISDSEREFCLYVKGREKLQFHYGVYLLNKNIAQIRWLCGLPTSDLRNTLENLSSLVKIKVESSNLDQSSRSLSSSTADICSTISVSSPLGSVLSYQAKKNFRVHRLSESGADTYLKSNSPSLHIPGHRFSKSVGSSKDLSINLVSGRNKKLENEKDIARNLSCSLDKGLNEYKKLPCTSELAKDSQFGSEPTLNNSDKVPKATQSEAKVQFLKTWDAESQKAPFSDDDTEVHMAEFNLKKQNLLAPENILSDKGIKESGSSNEEKTSDESSLPILTNSSIEEPVVNESCQSRENSNNQKQTDSMQITCNMGDTQETGISSDIKNCDVSSSVVLTDTLLESVTSRTEALVNQTICFNRFKSRFKNTLESSN